MFLKKIFTDYRQLQVFLLAIFSGAPLAVLYTTLFAWLKDENIEIKIITTFAIARAFYSLKVLWAPVIDHVKLPFISFLGQRRSWMIFCSSLIGIILFLLSYCDPNESIASVYYLAIALGIASASFDIAFDAFRIEKIDKEKQAIGAANTILGYRLGMLISGAGALWFADNYGWELTFVFLATLYLLCNLIIISASEGVLQREKLEGFSLKSWKLMAIDPFNDFFRRPFALIILLAVIFYKLGDAMFGVVATPFYMELGFTKTEIASIVKLYGLVATILGSYMGGYLMLKKGDIKGLMLAGFIQMVCNSSFIWLHHQGHVVSSLAIAITVENIGSGISNAALIGYLSNLCNRTYSATQYALLSSASGLFSHTIVVYGGKILEMSGWDMYFVTTMLLAVPGLMLLYYLDGKIKSTN